MKLAILHYHLNRGGVTQVIANHLRSLASIGTATDDIEQIVILFGGRHSGWPQTIESELNGLQLKLVAEPLLEYQHEQEANLALIRRLPEVLQREGLTADDTLLHFHNHSIGKNAALSLTIARLGKLGYRQLLQIHDFAEDNRPHNYRYLARHLASDAQQLGAKLYPQATHIHYATLNGRDHSLLTSAGLVPDRLHALPNPVQTDGPTCGRNEARSKLNSAFGVATDRRVVVYPVRPIRRKNLGELLLWSALTPDTTFGVTLIPLNQAEAASYRRWSGLIDDLELPVLTGLGEAGGLQFAENMAAADALITTSIAEGFGMVFLDSWVAGCPLIGRDLPEITGDFRQAGVEFPALAPRFAIPLAWIGHLPELRSNFAETLNGLLESFGRSRLTRQAAEAYFDELVDQDTIDFASLDFERQADIVRLVHTSRTRQEQLRLLNPFTDRGATIDRHSCVDTVSGNAVCISQNYSLPVSGEKLMAVYRKLRNSPVSDIGALDRGGKILEAFLDPKRLRLIRIRP